MRLKFPGYRRYKEARVAASDALMALLIGARLGEHALKTSPASQDVRLPELFGRIAGIDRVNRTVGDAARLLSDAEHHLASMGIPYVLGVHGAFLSDVISMLRDAGHDMNRQWVIPWRPDPKNVPLDEIHEYVAERCGEPFPTETLALFHLSRRVRNRIIHFGGFAGSRLRSEYRSLPATARAEWEELAGKPLSVDADGKLELSEGELIAVLAMTNRLARSANEMLVRTLSRAYWARVAVADYQICHRQHFGEQDQRLRRLMGFARVYYGAIGLTREEIESALGS